jgi:hypothetical protein
MLLSSNGIVQIDYKEEIQEGKSVNDIFTTFIQKGDDGMPVVLRAGDHIVINKLPKSN